MKPEHLPFEGTRDRFRREQALQNTLVTAQRLSEEIKEQAGKEGELVVQEARLRADRILKDAKDELSRLEMDQFLF